MLIVARQIAGSTSRGSYADRFLGAARCRHVTDHGWQHSVCVLPADQIEALEGFVDEISLSPRAASRPRPGSTVIVLVAAGGETGIQEISC